MSREESPRQAATSGGRVSQRLGGSTIAMLPRQREPVATGLDPDRWEPDLWVALATLDRAFGADQVTVASVTLGRSA